MPHHNRGAFRFACVEDRGCRGTSLGGALSVLLIQDKRGTVGFGAGAGLGFAFLGGGSVQMWSVVLASFFRLLFIW